ncbi:MAG: DUF4390 domain-containing protein [Candidatus Competibacterales bacterium]
MKDHGTRLGRSSPLLGWLLLILGLLGGPWAFGAGFTVVSAHTQQVGQTYLLSARIDYRFSPEVLEALESGLGLTVVLEMEVRRRRRWLWDDPVARVQLPLHLEYHTLLDKFQVTNPNLGRRGFDDLSTALTYMGHIRNFPLVDTALLVTSQNYYGRLRARLDTDDLPAPLQLTAYFSRAWQLTSQWYDWPL